MIEVKKEMKDIRKDLDAVKMLPEHMGVRYVLESSVETRPFFVKGFIILKGN